MRFCVVLLVFICALQCLADDVRAVFLRVILSQGGMRDSEVEKVCSGKSYGEDVSLPLDWNLPRLKSRSVGFKINGFLFLDAAVKDYEKGSLSAGRLIHDYTLSWCTNNVNFVRDAWPWHDDATARRVARFSYYYAYYPELFSGGDRQVLADSLSRQAKLLADESFYTKNHNHGMYQDFALLSYARLACPEERLKATYENLAKNRVLRYWRYSFSEDGVHKEHSPSYAAGVTSMIVAFCDVIGDSDVDFCAAARAYVDGTRLLLSSLAKPDGVIPPLGDSKPMPCKESDEAPIRVFSKGGYGVLRSDDRRTWALLSAAAHSVVHKHSDDLQALVYRDGDIFVEAGNKDYDYSNSETAYTYSGYAHNVICVNDRSYPVKVGGNGFQSIFPDALSTRIVSAQTNQSFVAVTGFQKRFKDVRQTRTIQLARDGNSVEIADGITSARACKITLLFHLAPGVSGRIGSDSASDVCLYQGEKFIGVFRSRPGCLRIVPAGSTDGPYRTQIFNGRKEAVYSDLILVDCVVPSGETVLSSTLDFSSCKD